MRRRSSKVSVLFSEPKIPQSSPPSPIPSADWCFSALQRAENSSIRPRPRARKNLRFVSVLFSEPKIPQCGASLARDVSHSVSVLFSEPKIPQFNKLDVVAEHYPSFQCSSASRKFLNSIAHRTAVSFSSGFSALQRAENSSIGRNMYRDMLDNPFQCSSASRKFLNSAGARSSRTRGGVSVLFSEPKIPQYCARRLRKSTRRKFQCSSASRKFLNRCAAGGLGGRSDGFSALQRAENSSIV